MQASKQRQKRKSFFFFFRPLAFASNLGFFLFPFSLKLQFIDGRRTQNLNQVIGLYALWIMFNNAHYASDLGFFPCDSTDFGFSVVFVNDRAEDVNAFVL